MDIPSPLIAAFPPSADLLLDRARRHIDDAMLRDIAKADYGNMANEMLALLRPIRDQGTIPTPMHGQLTEVLALTRWCNPAKPEARPFEPGPTGLRGHQTRLFSCAVLLRSAAEPYADDSTLAQCLASAKALGEEMSEAIGCLITWRLLQTSSHPEPVLFALGLLIVATRLRSGRFADQQLGNVAEWVIAEDALHRRALAFRRADPMPISFSLQRGLWQPLAAELKDDAAAIQTENARTNIQLCARLLETD